MPVRSSRRVPPRPPRVLTGAALLIEADNIRALSPHQDWQNAAWRFYDQDGELRYATSWIANAMSKVRLLAARLPDATGDPPQIVTDGPAFDAVRSFAGGVVGQSQLLSTLAVHLTIPGVGYLVAEDDETTGERFWLAASADEVRRRPGGADAIQLREENGDWRDLSDNSMIVKAWRAHKRERHQPDSPVRPLLDTLAEIEVLSSSIRAQATSRLAGAGIFAVPAEAEWQAPPRLTVPGEPIPDSEDQPSFYEDLIRTMTAPLADPSNPAAVVPLLLQMPGEMIAHLKHLRFDGPLDEQALALREAAIRRLSLGLEVPPEILLGMGDVNHWSAWEISESALTFHIEPLAEIICDALTEGFLRPALSATSVSGPEQFVVWYTTDDLRVRPDRSGTARDLFDRGQLSAEALRRESGFSESDAPSPTQQIESILLQALLAAPAAMAAPVLETLYPGADWDAFRSAAPPPAPTALPPGDDAPVPADGPPPRSEPAPPDEEEPASADDVAASGGPLALVADVLVAACDGLVVAALRTATSRMASVLGRGRPGGPASVSCASGPLWKCYSVAPSDVDALFAGAWERVPEVASRHSDIISAPTLQACLDGYCKGIVRAGLPHDYDRLAAALGR